MDEDRRDERLLQEITRKLLEFSERDGAQVKASQEGAQQKSAELTLLLIRAYRSLYGRKEGDEKKIVDWLTQYNADLDSVPIQLIRDTQDLAKVVKYLDAVRG